TLQPASLSPSAISVTVPAAVIAAPGTLSVTVTNPGPVVSNSLPLTVTPAMRLTAINPDSATAGSPGFTMTLTGINFPAGATAQWNGQALSTTTGTTTQLTATVPTALLATQGTASVTVSGGGLTSNALPFTINPVPPPIIPSLSPSSSVVGGAA